MPPPSRPLAAFATAGCAIAALALVGVAGACVAPPRSLPSPGDLRIDDIDKSRWSAALSRHIAQGAVDYAGLCSEPALEDLTRQIADVAVRAEDSTAVRLAFWIDAYNATAISHICRGLAADTLAGRYRFFWRERAAIAGESITLWDLEHQRMRPLAEPRIHFALVCASQSCPGLRPETWSATRLDAQLDEATRRFINDPSRNRFDLEAATAELSTIFDWYEEDFVDARRSLADFVAAYVEDAAVAKALANDQLRLHFLPYDWSLNGTR